MILNNLQLNKFKKLIKADYPDFEIKAIKPLKEGWDNFVVEINNSYVFRFPKKANFNFNKEIKILEELRGVISLKIPEYEFIGRKSKYVGYKKIKGCSLSLKIINNLRPKERRILINDIATFLFEFHSAMPTSKAKRYGIKIDNKEWEVAVIRKKVLGKLLDKKLLIFIEENFQRYLQLNHDKKNLVIAYNDLHEENVAFNKRLGRLAGIFDFSDVALEHIGREFYRLFAFDQKLALAVIKRYEKISGRVIDIQRIYIYAVIDSAAVLGVFSDNYNSSEYKHALNKLLKLERYKMVLQ